MSGSVSWLSRIILVSNPENIDSKQDREGLCKPVFFKLYDVKYFCTDKFTTHCTVSKKIVKHWISFSCIFGVKYLIGNLLGIVYSYIEAKECNC